MLTLSFSTALDDGISCERFTSTTLGIRLPILCARVIDTRNSLLLMWFRYLLIPLSCNSPIFIALSIYPQHIKIFHTCRHNIYSLWYNSHYNYIIWFIILIFLLFILFFIILKVLILKHWNVCIHLKFTEFTNSYYLRILFHPNSSNVNKLLIFLRFLRLYLLTFFPRSYHWILDSQWVCHQWQCGGSVFWLWNTFNLKKILKIKFKKKVVVYRVRSSKELKICYKFFRM